MKGKKAIVTGGAGFIGSHLVEELARRGYHVLILDDLSSGKMGNIEILIKKKDVEFVNGSITDLPLLQRIFKGVEYVFHQAAIASVPRSIDDPLLCHEVNVTGTLNVLIAARDNNVKKVISASSSAVYGDAEILPVSEETLPNPASPYAVNKLSGEYYCQTFLKTYGLPTVCLRYFNVYGPKQDPKSAYAAVVPRFIATVSEGNPPIIFGDGEQTRDFMFVEDVVEANMLAAENDVTGVFNIGSGDSITVKELAELLINIIGKKLKCIHREPRLGDIRHSLADIARARNFGYEPKHSLEEGLLETIRSFRHKH